MSTTPTPSPEADPARSAAEEIFAGYEHKEGLRCHGELAPNSLGWFRRTKEDATAIIQRRYGPVIAEKDRLLVVAAKEPAQLIEISDRQTREIQQLRAQLATAQAAAEELNRRVELQRREIIETRSRLDAANKRADAAEEDATRWRQCFSKMADAVNHVQSQLTASRTAHEETRRAGVKLREAGDAVIEAWRKSTEDDDMWPSIRAWNVALTESRALDANLGGDDIARKNWNTEMPVIPSDPASRAVTSIDALTVEPKRINILGMRDLIPVDNDGKAEDLSTQAGTGTEEKMQPDWAKLRDSIQHNKIPMLGTFMFCPSGGTYRFAIPDEYARFLIEQTYGKDHAFVKTYPSCSGETLSVTTGALSFLEARIAAAPSPLPASNELAELREAIDEIAKQKTTDEMVKELRISRQEITDYEDAYNLMIEQARAARKAQP